MVTDLRPVRWTLLKLRSIRGEERDFVKVKAEGKTCASTPDRKAEAEINQSFPFSLVSCSLNCHSLSAISGSFANFSTLST